MKKTIEYLGFDDEEEKRKVGRPKLADKETKKKSLIIACLSFFAVILLLVFGYGTLFGFNGFDLLGTVNGVNKSGEEITISEIKPLVKNITLKQGTTRKVYLTINPASASNKTIKYVSSNEDVAAVSKDGKVTGVAEGEAIITATTTDGSSKSATFNVKVIEDATGSCSFTSLNKTSEGVEYTVKCDNAKLKDVQYKIGDNNYEKLLTKKLSDIVPFSEEQMKEEITFKVVYYPNNSKVSKYKTRKLENKKTTTSKINGSCELSLDEVRTNSIKYDVSCNNASVTKIAYKIGNGSYVGIDSSSLADTVLFEESDVTRIIYFNVEYVVDGSKETRSISKNSIIQATTNLE